MTITQTIEIPVDRRVTFEFLAPEELPAGKARVEVKLTPVVEKQTDRRSDTVPTPRADALLGAAANMGDISLEEIRDERLSKYLK